MHTFFSPSPAHSATGFTLGLCVYSVLARLIFKYSWSQKGIHLSDKKVMAPPVILLVIHSTYTSIPIHPPDIFSGFHIYFFLFRPLVPSIMNVCKKTFSLIFTKAVTSIAVSHVTTYVHISHNSYIYFEFFLYY